MKCLVFALVSALALITAPALSQTGSGSWELSLAGNLGSQSSSSEFSSGGQTHSSDGEGIGYFGLDIRAGVYVLEGLSIEPEIYMLAVESAPPAFNLGANLGYTFSLPESPFKPFVIAGYGIGNGTPLMQRMYGRSSDEFDIPVLRVGGGVKVFVSRQVALKLEYRYERYSQEETSTYYGFSSTWKRVLNFHNVLFGFSVFIPGGE